MGKQPYGYLRNKDNPKQWVVDEEAAEVVKKIFALCVDGKGPMQIARMLQKEKILTIKSYYAKCAGKPLPDNPYLWDANSVSKICLLYTSHTDDDPVLNVMAALGGSRHEAKSVST